MRNRHLILAGAFLCSISSLFLPVVVREYFEGGWLNATYNAGDREYIAGIEYEFPSFLVVPLALLIASLLIGIGRKLGFAITGLILTVLTVGYGALLFFMMHFTIFASYTTHTGIGFYLMALGILTVLVVSIMQIARPKGVQKKGNEFLLDDQADF